MGRRKKGLDTSGWVVFDKPLGMTSTQAVSKIKWLFNANKAGHAGTLDPEASGLLPIALGEATKTVPFAMDGTKVYRFTVSWGIETNTDDTEGGVVATSDARPSAKQIEAILPNFTGTIMQAPPAFSAIKINGERAYDMARAGETIVIPEREITVDELVLVAQEDSDSAVFEATCGKGTYVRALARDMGRALGTYGHVTKLRRLVVEPFGEADMISLEVLEKMRHKSETFAQDAFDGMMSDVLLPVQTVLDDIPALAMTRQDTVKLQRGQAVLLGGRDAPLHEALVSVLSDGQLIAIGEVRQGFLHPKRVFNLRGG